MGEKISPDIIFFQYFNNIGVLLCGCLAEAKGCLCAAVAQALLGGGTPGPQGIHSRPWDLLHLQAPGPGWMRGVLGDPTRGPCRMGTGGRGRGRCCFFSGSVKKSLIR